ncbi:hypothetical protein ACFY2R_08485 [Micromonospora olivasterospora]|uniref:MFS transporter n=1 Tax=Micromonospora olivasterospora TaxID=1880 RepID=A0A562I7P8_MICOL|nr:hypothetical protein [Micromonospora olivasterospora]TWH67037.1 hypothetical protein JD77_01999 [Micromonospora olivasterospora]
MYGLNFALLNLGIGVGGLISGAIVDIARPTTFQLIYVLDAVSYLTPALILLTLPGSVTGSPTPRRAGRRRRAGAISPCCATVPSAVW